MVFWPTGLLDACGTKAKNHTQFLETNDFLALPPKAARPNNHLFPKNMWFLALSTPLNKHVANKNTSGSL
jgi:hypothetical protein